MCPLNIPSKRKERGYLQKNEKGEVFLLANHGQPFGGDILMEGRRSLEKLVERKGSLWWKEFLIPVYMVV